MTNINELSLAKELIKFPSVTPKDFGVIGYLSKKLKQMGNQFIESLINLL